MRACMWVISAAAIALAAPANAETSGGADITLVVPEFCSIESSVVTLDSNGTSARGTVFEMCNSGRGFRILASHRALAAGEEVQINYGGEIRQLDSSGLSDLVQRFGPVARDVPVEIQANGLVQGLSVSLGFAAL